MSNRVGALAASALLRVIALELATATASTATPPPALMQFIMTGDSTVHGTLTGPTGTLNDPTISPVYKLASLIEAEFHNTVIPVNRGKGSADIPAIQADLTLTPVSLEAGYTPYWVHKMSVHDYINVTPLPDLADVLQDTLDFLDWIHAQYPTIPKANIFLMLVTAYNPNTQIPSPQAFEQYWARQQAYADNFIANWPTDQYPMITKPWWGSMTHDANGAYFPNLDMLVEDPSSGLKTVHQNEAGMEITASDILDQLCKMKAWRAYKTINVPVHLLLAPQE